MIWLYIAIATVFILAVWIFLWYSNNALTVTKYQIGAPKDLNIVQLSDLHGKSFGKNGEKLFKSVQALSPDIIAITGDIIHKYEERDIQTAIYTIERLKKIAPVYFVSGNHEMRSTRYRKLRESLKEAGATVLDNSFVELDNITLYGLNCASQRNSTLSNLVKSDNNFKILLAHKPQFIEKFESVELDLVLSGHTHGGQWRIPFTNVGVYSPGQGLFPKYCGGLYALKNSTLIVSRGLGNSQCPFRLFNRPEITLIVLKK